MAERRPRSARRLKSTLKHSKEAWKVKRRFPHLSWTEVYRELNKAAGELGRPVVFQPIPRTGPWQRGVTQVSTSGESEQWEPSDSSDPSDLEVFEEEEIQLVAGAAILAEAGGRLRTSRRATLGDAMPRIGRRGTRRRYGRRKRKSYSKAMQVDSLRGYLRSSGNTSSLSRSVHVAPITYKGDGAGDHSRVPVPAFTAALGRTFPIKFTLENLEGFSDFKLCFQKMKIISANVVLHVRSDIDADVAIAPWTNAGTPKSCFSLPGNNNKLMQAGNRTDDLMRQFIKSPKFSTVIQLADASAGLQGLSSGWIDLTSGTNVQFHCAAWSIKPFDDIAEGTNLAAVTMQVRVVFAGFGNGGLQT